MSPALRALPVSALAAALGALGLTMAVAVAVAGSAARYRVRRRLRVGPAGLRAAPMAHGGAIGPVTGGFTATEPVVLTAAAGAVTVAVVAVGGTRWLVGAAVAAAAGAATWRRHRHARPARLRRTQLPEALDRLAAALRGGASVPGALVTAGGAVPAPLGPELAALGHEASGGRATLDVVDDWARRHDDAGTHLVATALALASTVGAAPARAADGVAATLRERADLAAERRALAAQARASAAVLSVAPVAFALLLGATDAATTRFLLGSPAGWACLAAGLGLDAAGALWMARLTRSEP